jgi:Uma2 family endonuclease
MNLALEGLKPPLLISSPEPLTVEQFWHFASEHPDLRMEREANGDIRIMTPTKRITGSKNRYINRMLGNWADEDGRGECFDSSTGFEQPDTAILSPDAAWVSFEKGHAAEQDGEELPLCPEFVIELRSKSDSLAELREKMSRWIGYGSELAWLVDPARKALEIYRPGREVEVLEGGSVVEGEGPVAGFVLELGKVWG